MFELKPIQYIQTNIRKYNNTFIDIKREAYYGEILFSGETFYVGKIVLNMFNDCLCEIMLEDNFYISVELLYFLTSLTKGQIKIGKRYIVCHLGSIKFSQCSNIKVKIDKFNFVILEPFKEKIRNIMKL